MLKIKEKQRIEITRGDYGVLSISAILKDGQTKYVFQKGDVVSFKVAKPNNCGAVVLEKAVTVDEETTEVDIELTKEKTTIGDIINEYVDYWYEVVLNPDTYPQTIIGYEVKKPKIFRLLPELENVGENND